MLRVIPVQYNVFTGKQSISNLVFTSLDLILKTLNYLG